MRRLPLHTKILLGMFIGIVWGISASSLGWVTFTMNWIKPFGSIFVSLLKLVAVPLVIVTIVEGIASLSNMTKLTRIGGKTLAWFFGLSMMSAAIGLTFSLVFDPGKTMPREKTEELKAKYSNEVSSRISSAEEIKKTGPLKILEDMVPDNIFFASQDNRKMLQVIFFSILFGIGIVMSPPEKVKVVRRFFQGVNEVILKIVNIIMLYAPIGVFALIASLIVDLAGNSPTEAISILKVLLYFSLVFILGLVFLVFVVYPLFIRRFTTFGYWEFMKAMGPAELVAFSTSSSAATLPVTLECTEQRLKVRNEIAGFVLPLGITINMHGTAVHQALCAVFIAHAFGHDLTFTQYLIIIFTSTLSSMGSPAVPGAGIIMLLIVLGAIGVEPEGIALILAVDRPLDMLRTIPNILGDAMVAAILEKNEGRNLT